MPHTPGPWAVDDEMPTRVEAINDEDELLIRPIVAICTGFGYTHPDGRRDDMDNARLIAASPSMYEYIKRRAALGDNEAITVLKDCGLAESVE